MASEVTVEGNSENWTHEVENADRPVLVDFWAEWCGPCRAIAPILDELAEELSDQLKVVKVDVDQEMDLAGKYNVVSIPTLLLLQNGEVLEQIRGSMPKEKLKGKIEPHLKNAAS